MVRGGIVLGHLVSERGIEVDRAKIEVKEQLPPSTNVKGVRSFLGHVGFYRRFIKDFSHIARPLTRLLAKDAPFEFDGKCLNAFQILKKALISTPIIQPLDWSLPFEILCHNSDYAVGQFWVKQKIESIMQFLMLVKLCQDLNLIMQQLKKSSWLLFLLLTSLGLT
jgi:hypothetical protein